MKHEQIQYRVAQVWLTLFASQSISYSSDFSSLSTNTLTLSLMARRRRLVCTRAREREKYTVLLELVQRSSCAVFSIIL